MTRETIRLFARLAFCAAAGFAYFCAIAPSDPGIVAYDKGNHLIAFATLAVLARLGWSRSRAGMIAVLLIAFGGLIEISQAMPIVHRDASWGDFWADVLAVALGLTMGAGLLHATRTWLPGEPAPSRG